MPIGKVGKFVNVYLWRRVASRVIFVTVSYTFLQLYTLLMVSDSLLLFLTLFNSFVHFLTVSYISLQLRTLANSRVIFVTLSYTL